MKESSHPKHSSFKNEQTSDISICQAAGTQACTRAHQRMPPGGQHQQPLLMGRWPSPQEATPFPAKAVGGVGLGGCCCQQVFKPSNGSAPRASSLWSQPWLASGSQYLVSSDLDFHPAWALWDLLQFPAGLAVGTTVHFTLCLHPPPLDIL